MIHSFSAPLLKHLYVYVNTEFTHKDPIGFIPAVWFGLRANPGCIWGCHVLFENGACYRNVPIHALRFGAKGGIKGILQNWTPKEAQKWDCYGSDFSLVNYTYLEPLECVCRIGSDIFPGGEYLFTVVPCGDGYSEEPEQNKEFTFVALQHGPIRVAPTNMVLFRDRSFTTEMEESVREFPRDLKIQTEKWSCED